MAAHTKGPWRVEEGTTLIWGACNPDDSSTYGMGYPIIECRISPASQWAVTKGPKSGEGEANAHLTAAAPDLLEALFACEKQAEEVRLILIGHLNEPERTAFWKAINIREFARAAIAKATASTPTREGGEA